jgi:hypothetical protein
VYLAVCAAFRDEAPYLAEWLAFHEMMGVEHFFLYDNHSSDLPQAVLEPWVRAGTVTAIDCALPFSAGGQEWVYADALTRARDQTRWLAFIDLDEFLFAPGGEPLPAVLRDYERHPGVVVNWQIYGSAGHRTKPDGLVIERFDRRAARSWVRNRRVKSIVDPMQALRARGVHFFEYADGALAVNENHDEVRILDSHGAGRAIKRRLTSLGLRALDPYAVRNSSVRRVTADRLRINHYVVKSRAEFEAKRARWDGGQARVDRDYFRYHDRNEVHDPILVQYAPALRRRLQELGRPTL